MLPSSIGCGHAKGRRFKPVTELCAKRVEMNAKTINDVFKPLLWNIKTLCEYLQSYMNFVIRCRNEFPYYTPAILWFGDVKSISLTLFHPITVEVYTFIIILTFYLYFKHICYITTAVNGKNELIIIGRVSASSPFYGSHECMILKTSWF